MYHNRGDTDFVRDDEDSQYGDFFGLDDLFTERPEVVVRVRPRRRWTWLLLSLLVVAAGATLAYLWPR